MYWKSVSGDFVSAVGVVDGSRVLIEVEEGSASIAFEQALDKAVVSTRVERNILNLERISAPH